MWIWKKTIAFLAVFCMIAAMAACGAESAEQESAPAEKTGDVAILFTSDVHCGIDSGFGYAGVQQVRDLLDAQALMDYIRELPGGEIGGEYADPYGQGRITVIDR